MTVIVTGGLGGGVTVTVTGGRVTVTVVTPEVVPGGAREPLRNSLLEDTTETDPVLEDVMVDVWGGGA